MSDLTGAMERLGIEKPTKKDASSLPSPLLGKSRRVDR
jgi:hypothetical protein